MFASQKSTGAGAMTIAYLLVAFIFSPALLVVWRPLGYTSVSLVIACSAFCIAMAWAKWKKSRDLSRPSIEGARVAK
jgi:predicted membrane channel-forming protein YqfA (hemolysin III family)